MDLHPLHRTQNTFASQPNPSPMPPTAVEGVVEPLEYTVKRMAQEIEALRLTAQYNMAKAQKYKMQLTAALAESETGEALADKVGKYKEYILQLRASEQEGAAKLEKYKQHIQALRASGQEGAEKLDKYKERIQALRSSGQEGAEKLDKYKEHIQALRSSGQEGAEKLERYRAHIQALRASGQEGAEKLERYKAQIRERADSEQAVHGKLQKYKEYVQEIRAQGGSEDGEGKLKALRDKYRAVAGELADMKAELPRVKQLLREGGEATRRLDAVTADAQERIKTLRQKLADSRADVLASAGTIHELTTARELTEATAAPSSSLDRVGDASTTKACAEMLAKTHMVLHTCSQFYASQDGGAQDEMASALCETTDNVAAFLETLRRRDVHHGKSAVEAA